MKGRFLAALPCALLVTLAACGGGGNSSGSSAVMSSAPPPTNNVQPVVMDFGPTVNGQQVGNNDTLYTTVTICAPGTTTCQSIDHILVDTGSSGLRIVSSQVAMTLPYVTDATSSQLGNCVQYADTTYQWGPLVKVDVKMAGEVASSVPVQIVGATNFPAAPTDCSVGGSAVQTTTDLGANGILGVGLFRQDCGAGCNQPSPPGVYYTCPSTGCVPTAVAVSAQLQNPVWMFPQDNNGLVIILPQIAATGAASVAGSMIFGIGTQADNALNGAQAEAPNANGYLTTTFNGVAYSKSFIDSGSNGFFFLDSATTGLPDCSSTGIAQDFYCPPSPVSLTAIITGANPSGSRTLVSQNIAFSIGNALTLIPTPEVAYNNLGGPDPGMFDWGLPFFFGRSVFVAIEGQTTPAGTGPYWAF